MSIEAVKKYWYHFAIMFEALFILTTIDAGTRIARFLLQEALGKIWKPFERTDWLPGAIIATAVVTAGWGGLIWAGSIDTIWPMFGIANQLLAVIALTVVTTWIINSGRGRYAALTIAADAVRYRFDDDRRLHAHHRPVRKNAYRRLARCSRSSAGELGPVHQRHFEHGTDAVHHDRRVDHSAAGSTRWLNYARRVRA